MRSRKKANVVVGAELGVSGGRAVLDELPGVSRGCSGLGDKLCGHRTGHGPR